MQYDQNTQAVPPPVGAPSSEDRTLALITHLSGILLSFIVPLVIWLTNKDKSGKDWLNDQAKEALNFQITIAIGFLLYPVLWIGNLIFCILAAMKANEGVAYRYPFALRLIK